MGKVLGIITGAILIGAAIFTGGGSLGLLGLTVSKGTLIAMGATLALTNISTLMMGPKMPSSQLERLNVSLETTAPRKSVFGTTAMNLDLRYQEASGSQQEYIDYVIAVAAHKVKSIDQIWFEEKLAWSAGTGVSATYSGYLTVETILEGSASNYFTINGGSKWGADERLTGCAQVHLRIKRLGPDDKTQSPLASGLPSRVTIIGDGALLYDPRKDSTVIGGSGTHRANDQSTWGSYTDSDDTDNPALQLLWFLLGWRINGQLSVGCGVPPARIDLESFITAANICDENVTLAIGGTQKRYRTSGTASDSDDRMEIINTFLSCMNASLRDNNGQLSLTVIKNDLADYVLTFDEGDVLDEFEWNQTRGLNESYNKARGRYVDPSNNSLYQLVDYPEVGFASPDGIDRVMTLDLPYVEDGRRAQRIAKQVLQRNQYKGMFSATFTAKAQGCSVGEVVRLTFPALGWSNKLFRVVSQEIRFDGQVPMALIEENAAIYAWDADDVAPVSPNAPTVYDPLNNPILLAISEAAQPATLDGLAPVNLYADYLGVFLTAQLPKSIAVVRRRGGTDVSSTTTWSIVNQAGISGATVTISSSGVVTIPTGITMGSTASILVRSVRDGVTLETVIGVTKLNEPAPSTGGGGTSGGTTVTDSAFDGVSGTSFIDITNVMTVQTGTVGQIQLSAPLSVTAEADTPIIGGASGNVEMIWQYRAIGGTFADVSTAVSSDPDVAVYYDAETLSYFVEDGYVNAAPTLTGLAANTDYEVKLRARRTYSTPTKTLYFFGTASAVGS